MRARHSAQLVRFWRLRWALLVLFLLLAHALSARMALSEGARSSLLVVSHGPRNETNRVSDPQALQFSAPRQRIDGGRANCPAHRQVLDREQPAHQL